MGLPLGRYTLQFIGRDERPPMVVPYPRHTPSELEGWPDDAPYHHPQWDTISEHGAAWMLGRLWHLTNGEIVHALNVDPETMQGGQDAGFYYFHAVVLDVHGDCVATYFFSGSSELLPFVEMEYCSVDHDPVEIHQLVMDLLWQAPGELGNYHISISDPERPGFALEYGWDGEKYLGLPKARLQAQLRAEE